MGPEAEAEAERASEHLGATSSVGRPIWALRAALRSPAGQIIAKNRTQMWPASEAAARGCSGA